MEGVWGVVPDSSADGAAVGRAEHCVRRGRSRGRRAGGARGRLERLARTRLRLLLYALRTFRECTPFFIT